MIIGVLADTHVPARAKDLPAKAYQLLAGADAIVHAGDVMAVQLLDRLATIAPVFAVLGNNDRELDLPERLELSWEDVRIAVVHDSGPSRGRASRLRGWFPTADVVIFGHSHIPMNVRDQELLLFNPGSPTDRRRQPDHTIGLLHLHHGQVRGEILVV